MIHAKIDVKLHSHPKARKAGPAMATWTWALCYIRDHETDGFIPDVAIGASWVGETQARKDAAKLVAVGLWERSEPSEDEPDGGWRMRKYADKNETRAEIDVRRAGDRGRKRMGSFRNPDGIRTESKSARPDSVVGIPGSGSGSGSGSVISESRSEDPDSTPREVVANDVPPVSAPQLRPLAQIPDPSGPPPEWWDGVLATIEMATTIALASGECWLAYAGHRAGKRFPATREDALQWLTQVMVPKAKTAAADERRQRDRDTKYDLERRANRYGPPGHEAAPPPTPQQAKQFAAELAARVAASRKGAA